MYNKAEPQTVQKLFSSIAIDYDRTNSILSLGFHRYWNHALIKAVSFNKPKILLDLCAGTGEIAFGFFKKRASCEKAILLDFCPKMLEVAEKKREKDLFLKNCNIETIIASAEEIPLKDLSIDAVTIAYGIRNVSNTIKCYNEVYRVLKKEGFFAILELTRPSNPFLKFFHLFYLKTLLPFLGNLTAKDKAAYLYLSETVQHFSNANEIISNLKEQGFIFCEKKQLMGGIATLITCKKP